MRILMTNTSRMWGGTEHYTLRLAAGLSARGHAVRYLYTHEVVGERVREALPEHGRFRLRADADLLGLWRLYREIRKHRAEIVLLTKWREYLLGGLAARLSRETVPVMSLGLKVAPRRDLKRRIIFRNAGAVLVNAKEIRDALTRRPWIDPQRIHVVHNGIDLEHYRTLPVHADFRRATGIPSDAPLLLSIGALTPQKDHATLLRAMAQFAASRPDAHLALVGSGFLEAELRDLCARLGLDDRVHFAGFLRDVRPALTAADLFVLSSHNEGMPWVLLEALGAGLPIVATDVSGTRACVSDGDNGCVVPPGDPEALAAALVKVLDDPTALNRMSEVSRRLAAEHFDEERMIRDTEEVFLELLRS